ncbi:hypothetical protein [Micromonospora cathayae]|uniref:Uncharacterized protein n=1 Tax=Micromonospora cathayae TaxID=3028804 RepID=A0ABY7ZW45_9ACTN|nr:hypothetical protein [Micromonospora sp. HUAS 3]WDZ87046.1 hypothetical protein PVK37_11895 [Micromonospora sp. HUAS 3]
MFRRLVVLLTMLLTMVVPVVLPSSARSAPPASGRSASVGPGSPVSGRPAPAVPGRSAPPAAGSPAGSAPALVDDFALAADPSPVPVTAGFPARFTVTSTVTSGSSQAVALRVTNLPYGVSAVFTPATIVSGDQARLTVHTTLSARPGTFGLVVEGVGDVVTRRVTVTLVVRTPPTVRAAFYYPWFPEAWRQQGLDPFTNYRPTRGLYSVDEATVRQQVAEMREGWITLGVASWFGRGTTTDRHWPALMAGARDTGFGWAPYYEPEGTSDPTVSRLVDDLHYLRTTYGGARSPLTVLPGGAMLVFVYNANDLTTAAGCDTVNRWNAARDRLLAQYGEGLHVVLKVFPGYRTCAGTARIDGWHQYGPASPEADFSAAPGEGAYTVSPGFWKAGLPYGRAPFLSRNRDRWRSSVARMNASTARWQLVTTWNEWGEGTAIEASSGCRTPTPAGTLCDWSGDGISGYVADLRAVPPAGLG